MTTDKTITWSDLPYAAHNTLADNDFYGSRYVPVLFSDARTARSAEPVHAITAGPASWCVRACRSGWCRLPLRRHVPIA